MTDSPLDQVSKLTGVPRTKMLEIFEAIKANGRKLDKCEGPHDFEEIKTEKETLRKEFRCKKFGGGLDGLYVYWYRKGVEHGNQRV